METLYELVDKLDGKKSYIGGAILFLAGGFLALDVIDQKLFEIIAAIAGAISIYGLRNAVSKIKRRK